MIYRNSSLVEEAKTLKHNTLVTILMVLKKCDFCYEERECQKYEPDGWLCDRCQYIALIDT